jgi:hypothetical protein
MVTLKEYGGRQIIFTKMCGRKCASTADATISNLYFSSASSDSRRKLDDAQCNWNEHFCLNNDDIELGEGCGELVGRWSFSCGNKDDTSTATGHCRGSATSTA